MPAAGSGGNPPTMTTTNLAALWRQWQEIWSNYDGRWRERDAFDARIMAARPTEPADFVIQLRWLRITQDFEEKEAAMVDHLVGWLEAMAHPAVANGMLAALWQQHEAIGRRWDELGYDITDEEGDRLGSEQAAIWSTIQMQDPHDLAGILVQLRALADEMGGGHRPKQHEVLTAIIQRVERLAGSAAA
jgi:hypothetical protein